MGYERCYLWRFTCDNCSAVEEMTVPEGTLMPSIIPNDWELLDRIDDKSLSYWATRHKVICPKCIPLETMKQVME